MELPLFPANSPTHAGFNYPRSVRPEQQVSTILRLIDQQTVTDGSPGVKYEPFPYSELQPSAVQAVTTGED